MPVLYVLKNPVEVLDFRFDSEGNLVHLDIAVGRQPIEQSWEFLSARAHSDLEQQLRDYAKSLDADFRKDAGYERYLDSRLAR